VSSSFEIGDRVRVARPSPRDGIKNPPTVGSLGTVVNIRWGLLGIRLVNGTEWGFYPSEVDRIVEDVKQ